MLAVEIDHDDFRDSACMDYVWTIDSVVEADEHDPFDPVNPEAKS